MHGDLCRQRTAREDPLRYPLAQRFEQTDGSAIPYRASVLSQVRVGDSAREVICSSGRAGIHKSCDVENKRVVRFAFVLVHTVPGGYFHTGDAHGIQAASEHCEGIAHARGYSHHERTASAIPAASLPATSGRATPGWEVDTSPQERNFATVSTAIREEATSWTRTAHTPFSAK